MPTISTVAQGGAQRSEQYLEARTDEGARAARPPVGAGATMRQPRRVWLHWKKVARAAQRERAPQAQAASERNEPTGRRSPLDHRQRLKLKCGQCRLSYHGVAVVGSLEKCAERGYEVEGSRRRRRGRVEGDRLTRDNGTTPSRWRTSRSSQCRSFPSCHRESCGTRRARLRPERRSPARRLLPTPLLKSRSVR
jgi:hypothetical protein